VSRHAAGTSAALGRTQPLQDAFQLERIVDDPALRAVRIADPAPKLAAARVEEPQYEDRALVG